jgi:hypothetical protein
VKQLVLDLETKRSFDEVGGSHNKSQLGVSIVGLYNYETDSFVSYREADFVELEGLLKKAEQIIGFNLHGFDWPVLAAELGDWVFDLPSLDIMMEAQKSLGHRVSLDSVAKATLGMSKLGSGLDAPEYYRSGNWDKLERYCLEDVKLTRDIFEYAKKNGHLYFMKGKRRSMFALSFAESPFSRLFKEAAERQASVKMIYGAKERLIDVIRFDGIYIRAFCHLKKEELTFRLDRVEEAKEVASSTPLF